MQNQQLFEAVYKNFIETNVEIGITEIKGFTDIDEIVIL